MLSIPTIDELRADIKKQIKSYLIDMERDCKDKSESIEHLSKALHYLTISRDYNEV